MKSMPLMPRIPNIKWSKKVASDYNRIAYYIPIQSKVNHNSTMKLILTHNGVTKLMETPVEFKAFIEFL